MHFIYHITDKEGNKRKQSFNLNKVIRSVWSHDGKSLMVLLDDGHEETMEVVPPKVVNGKVVQEAVKRRVFLSSEIDLVDEDIDRFFEAIEK